MTQVDIHLPGWHPQVARVERWVEVPTLTTSMQVTTVPGLVLAMIMEETTGLAAARFQLFDGVNSGGVYLGPWTFAAGESFDNVYPLLGLVFRSGLFLNVTKGSVGGALQLGVAVPWPMHDEAT